MAPSARSAPIMRARRRALSVAVLAPPSAAVLVGVLRQGAQHAVEVGRGREQLVHQCHPPAGERRLARQRHHRRAGEPGIDELAAGEAVAVGHALGADGAVGQDQDVGGGAAEVDEQAVAQPACGQPGRGQPVGRRDRGLGRGTRGGATKPCARPRSARSAPGRAALRNSGRRATPVARSGNRSASSPVIVTATRRSGASRPLASAQRLLQPVEAEPERAGYLDRRQDAAIRRHLRHLEMRTADIEPGDQFRHRCFPGPC